MNPENPDAIKIFGEALGLSVPAERAAYLDRACAGKPGLREELELLLSAYARAGDFLDETRPISEPDLMIARTGTMVGRYKLLEKIGAGGFGVVYLAEQTEPVQRQVALKIIKPGMDTKEVIARFEAERQALALMDHPNIARVLDGGATPGGRPYFVMELVRGTTVTAFCDDHSLSPNERLNLVIKVCHAIQHAHQKGIIHRDIKPSNVLVTMQDGEAVPKVIDFGIAKALGVKLTNKTLFTGLAQMIGTPIYMSPEQAGLSGLDVDTRSDIYSLGVLLYELLTGTTPFDKETLANAALDEMRRIIRETDPPRPSTRLHTLGAKLTDVAKHRHTEPATLTRLVRGDLDWIVMRCLEKDRTRRYATARDLEQDLRRHLADEPVEASPPSQLYRLRKFVVRNKLKVASSAGFVALLVVALVLAVVAGKAQERLRHQAEMESRNSEARRLLTEANYVVTSYPQRGLLLFVEALKVFLDHGEPPTPAIEQALLPALTNISGFCLGASSGGMQCVALSPDRRWVAAGGREGQVRLWDLQSPNVRESARNLSQTTNLVSALTISSDSRWLASGDAKGTVTLWRLGMDGVRKSQELPLHTNKINAVAIERDSQGLVTACEGGLVGLWDLRVETAVKRTAIFLNDHRAISAVALTSDGNWLLLGDANGTLSVVRLPALALASRTNVTAHNSGKVNAVELRSDDREIVTASDDGVARLWQLGPEGKVELLRSFQGHRGSVTVAVYNPKGGVVTGGADGQVLAWPESASNTNPIPLVGHHDSVAAAGSSTSKGWIITGSSAEVFAWNLASSNTRPTIRVARSPTVLPAGELWSDPVAHAYAAYRGERNYVAEPNLPAFPENWDDCLDPLAILRAPAQPMNLRFVADTGLFPAAQVGGVTSIASSSKGERLVTSGYDGLVTVTERQTSVTLRGHEGPVSGVVVSSTGDLIASCGWDGSLRLWASPELEAKLPSLKPAFDVAQRIRAQLAQVSGKDRRELDHAAFARELVILARDRIGRNFTSQEWERVFPGRAYRKTFEEFPGL